MTIAFRTFRSDTSPMIDGLTTGKVLIDIVSVTAYTNGSKGYLNVSQTANVSWVVVRGGGPIFSVARVSGVVRLQWTYDITKPCYDTTILVFGSNLVTTDQYGIKVQNDAGETLVDPSYPSPQYVGKQALSTTPAAAYASPSGYTAIVHTTAVQDLRAGANKLVAMALPDSGANDTYYCLRKEYILASEGAVSISIVVFTKATSYVLPSLHIYALDQPIASADQYAVRVRDASSKVTFDSNVECMTARNALTIDYPAYGATPATNSYTLSFSNTPGICIPYHQYGGISSTNSGDSNRYTGVMKRVGTQLTVTTLLDFATSVTSTQDTDQYLTGGASARYCATADIIYQGPTAQSLTTPSAPNSAPRLSVLSDFYAPPNQSLQMLVNASGSPAPSLQWYRQGVAIAGATGSTYTFTPTTADDGVLYWCTATNAIGSVSTRHAKYVVDSHTGPTIDSMTYPSGNVAVGASVTVSATASGTPSVSTSLQLNGTVVATGGATISYTFTAAAGQTYAFQLTASAPAEHVTWSTDQFFNVTVAQSDPVHIVSNPSNVSTQSGNTAQFSVTVSGHAPYYYTWFKNGQGYGAPNAQTSSTTITLSYPVTAADNGATFHCVVNDYPVGDTFQYSAQSTDATLTVTSSSQSAPTPVFNTALSDQYVTAGNTASYSCSVSNYTSLQWYRNGIAVGNGSTSYSYVTAVGNDGDVVSVTATNAPANYTASSNTSTAHTHVSTQTTAPTPVFSASPQSQSVSSGATVSLSCSVSNYTSLQWYRNGSAISGATGTSYSFTASSANNGDVYNVHAINAPAGQTQSDNWSSDATITVTASAATFSSYNSISGGDVEYSAPAQVAIYSDGHCDNMTDWANPIGGGDGSLYEVMASSSNYNSLDTNGFYGVGVWYTLSGGVGWGINPTGATGNVSTCTLSISVRLISNQQGVTGGSVTLRTQNGGTQS